VEEPLGPAFIESFQNNTKHIVELQSNYQLTVENALEIGSYRLSP
jgi:hypothetical protein